MTPEIKHDVRRLVALSAAIDRAVAAREAIRPRLRQRHEDALQALLAGILDATDAARIVAEAMARAREALR